jgi:RimJ/RimL family protein N-acetyltransferase
MADVVIETERLILRPPARADLAWIRAAINTPAMMRNLGGEVRSDAAVEQSLAEDIAAVDTSDGHQRWTAVLKHGGERIGRIGLFRVRSEAAPESLRCQREIGWMVAEPHWRKGYASEAAAAVLDWAFGRGIPMVYSQTSDSNRGSTGVMRRLGLARRQELDYVDPDYPAADNPTTVWSITAEDWKHCNG